MSHGNAPRPRKNMGATGPKESYIDADIIERPAHERADALREKLASGPRHKGLDAKSLTIATQHKQALVIRDKIDGARAELAQLEDQLNEFEHPIWDHPNSWEMCSVKELVPGDGLRYQNIICIVTKKLAWWRSNTANVLIQEHHNPAKYYRIGTTDYVYAFKGYVSAQRASKWEHFLKDEL